MKRVFLLFLIHFFHLGLQAQEKPFNTYAVVVGISQYENEAIPSLQFAHRDAQAFADYLQTKAGGNVPQTHIRLLISEQATTAAVYDALQWVMDVAAENDRVYFYFAGHGDMENTTIFKLGFLLTYNTPANNYINNSIRLEDLNNFANTLSVGKKAKVILITDACHSGKLAGSEYRGNFLVGDQLRKTIANEIRITSCSPEELSMENEAWGGGRGVFSFYLIYGLIGFADEKKDGFVRLNEIKRYVDSAISSDPVLKANNKKQTPVIPVNNKTSEFVLSVIDTFSMNRQEAAGIAPVMMALAPDDAFLSPEMQVMEFFKILSEKDVSKIKGLTALLNSSVSSIPLSFIQLCLRGAEADTLDLNGKFIGVNRDYYNLLIQIEKAITGNEELTTIFKNELLLLLHTQTQEVINDYLDGSEAELERRRYYNAGSNGYDAYTVMLQIAMKLTDKDDYLYHAMEVNRYYFEGVSLMLKIPLTEKPEPLIEKALQLELKALELEKDAACIYNALGVLYLYKNDGAKAENYFLKAIERSPQWALPYSNLMGIYIQRKQQGKALEMYDKAMTIQPTLQNLYVNRGLLAEMQNNFLLAEELQRKSTVLNSRHYLPFERLGYIYTKTTSYAMADSFFYEADLRKRGFHLKPFQWQVVNAPFFEIAPVLNFCTFDTLKIKKNDILGYFAWGMFYFNRKDYTNAEIKWKYVIKLDTTNPLVFHYLGKMLFAQQRWMEADLSLNFAVKYYTDTTGLKLYSASLKELKSNSPDAECFINTFLWSAYNQTEDHYFLANMYEKWNHFTKAEYHYRKLISMTPDFIGPYKKLWTMLELLGRYRDAEELIINYRFRDQQNGDNELNAFYERVTKNLPGDGFWFLKAGQFLYHFSATTQNEFIYDKKAIFPDEEKPEDVQPEAELPDANPLNIILPGTKETFVFASAIKYPYSDGIRYLQKADSLLGANEKLSADVNDKIGDLYMWQGITAYAVVHYQKSVDMLDANTGVRNKLIDVYNLLYQFTKAGINLDTLAARNELSYEKLLLRTKYFIHAGSFDSAKSNLLLAKATYPYPSPVVADLFARNALLSSKLNEAVIYYTNFLESHPKDSVAMYSMSRVYALQKNKIKSWEWLNRAVKNGFNYGWVLQMDPVMEGLRKTSKFKALVAQTNLKQYPPPSNTYPRKR